MLARISVCGEITLFLHTDNIELPGSDGGGCYKNGVNLMGNLWPVYSSHWFLIPIALIKSLSVYSVSSSVLSLYSCRKSQWHTSVERFFQSIFIQCSAINGCIHNCRYAIVNLTVVYHWMKSCFVSVLSNREWPFINTETPIILAQSQCFSGGGKSWSIRHNMSIIDCWGFLWISPSLC